MRNLQVLAWPCALFLSAIGTVSPCVSEGNGKPTAALFHVVAHFDRIAPKNANGISRYDLTVAYESNGPMLFVDKVGPVAPNGTLRFATASKMLVFRASSFGPPIASYDLSK